MVISINCMLVHFLRWLSRPPPTTIDRTMHVHILIISNINRFFIPLASPNVSSVPVQSVLLYDDITLTCNIIARPVNFTVLWYHNSELINTTELHGGLEMYQNSNSSSIVIKNASLEDRGVYRCSVSNVHGSGSSTTTLRVQSK